MKSSVALGLLGLVILMGCGGEVLDETGELPAEHGPLTPAPVVIPTKPTLPNPAIPSTCKAPASCPGTNYLKNAGFENGLEGWSALFGDASADSTMVRSGQQSARLVVPQDRAVVSLNWQEAVIQDARAGAVFCAYAYVRGTAQNARVSIRRIGSNVDETFSSRISNTEWTRIPSEDYGGLSVTTQRGDSLYFRIFIPQARSTDELVVDDVMFWESTTGNCKDTPR